LETTILRRILLAVDGSDQALEVVRYVSKIVPHEHTAIVLFTVGTGFPEVFWEIKKSPRYSSQKSDVMGWLADNQLAIGEFKEKAYKILSGAGFSEKAISVKTQVKKIGVLKDIIHESYQGYHAIVVGRTGVSRLKYLIWGSLAQKLAERIRHIPTVIVGGKPRPGKILIALDDSIEAMRGVACVGAIAGPGDPMVSLCHCLDQSVIPLSDESAQQTSTGGLDWTEYHKNRFKPVMDEAFQRLVDAGVSPERISRDFVLAKGNIIQKIADIGCTGNFGTMVIGRREAISFTQEHFRGRFSEKVMAAFDNMAIWVVS